jgi:hypothetical protein
MLIKMETYRERMEAKIEAKSRGLKFFEVLSSPAGQRSFKKKIKPR